MKVSFKGDNEDDLDDIEVDRNNRISDEKSMQEPQFECVAKCCYSTYTPHGHGITVQYNISDFV